jgi:hypothetical protein
MTDTAQPMPILPVEYRNAAVAVIGAGDYIGVGSGFVRRSGGQENEGFPAWQPVR